jgi:hypothetical protein
MTQQIGWRIAIFPFRQTEKATRQRRFLLEAAGLRGFYG